LQFSPNKKAKATGAKKEERRTRLLTLAPPRAAEEQHWPTLPFAIGSAVQVLLLLQEPCGSSWRFCVTQ